METNTKKAVLPAMVFDIWVLLTRYTVSNVWEVKRDKKGREFLRMHFEKKDLLPGDRIIKSLVVYRYKNSYGVLVNAAGMNVHGGIWNKACKFLMKNQSTPVVLSGGNKLCTTVFNEWFLHHVPGDRIIVDREAISERFNECSVVDEYEGLEQPF